MGSRQARIEEADASQAADIPAEPRYEKKKVAVLGKQMAYYEAGSGASEETIIFVHGNPTSSYMWRNVMPHCEGLGRLIAPDLIGMGESEKLGNVDDADRYSMKEQSRYFSAFLDAVGVSKNVTFVAHSWGGTLTAHWGSRNPTAVRGLVSLEVVYVPFPSWERVPEKIRGGVKLMLRRPFKFGCCGCNLGSFDLGAHLILKKNLMLESMPDRVNRQGFVNTGPEMKHYRQGYGNDVESRRPILAFVRSIPVAGEPAEVVSIMDAGRTWIESSELPTLFLSVEPGTMTAEDRSYIRGWKNMTEVAVKGGHMVTEDSPDEVGGAIAEWFREKVVPG
mmetsp:Transcript_59012/g.80589  ORF Transcript_59012/g.80589 Transcript_59012/m.80589 type:complete len:335 (-) Transcript_59012:330-1334(-)|eukprot:CAMPEP_0185745692 /NCGR_PEP_ID=MMETSP1174-20130828/4089_1 /TAXON_ID=35687 /ORGANISM="Dictyocha speculum, Strain CCMP1381" /LENGTH=334 /DNA_ID=CAMNT_0028419865 /DNA_START=125 /DNA_END=1129 /DNA_ORIENTATION=+